ncbi:MAG: XRE family transcriptional regulator [Chloroflexota bacterium]|nr:MAG: XRE family transcriptional regulator [Chloroflexota bacterium]
MDPVRFGLSIRALRRRRRWTQRELGRRARVSRSEVSRVERGGAATPSLRILDAIVAALGARLLVRVLWQGEELDRILDREHARLVEVLLRRLSDGGWTAFPEITFQVAGERGSIDVLAWHERTRALLVVEVKSVVPDIQATLAGLDRKARLGPSIAAGRGWRAATVSRLLVLPENRTARRRIASVGATFDRALPARSVEVKRWLIDPVGPMSGLIFLSDSIPAGARHRVAGPRPDRERAAAPRR